MDPQTQKLIVQDRIDALHAEARANRLAASGRSMSKARPSRRRADRVGPPLRFDLVRWFMARFAHAG